MGADLEVVWGNGFGFQQVHEESYEGFSVRVFHSCHCWNRNVDRLPNGATTLTTAIGRDSAFSV